MDVGQNRRRRMTADEAGGRNPADVEETAKGGDRDEQKLDVKPTYHGSIR